MNQEHIVPVLLQRRAARLVAAASLSPNCRVLDLACGAGVVARIAAERLDAGGEAVGLDPSPAVLEVDLGVPFPANPLAVNSPLMVTVT